MKIPDEIQKILAILNKAKFQAYLVGGCVRDILSKKAPKDWDITTNAKPEKIKALFEKAGYKTFYENVFGTVSVVSKNCGNVEITPFRVDLQYTDKRHPDKIKWAKTIEQDLARRDFTINAIAANLNYKLQTPKESKPRTTTGCLRGKLPTGQATNYKLNIIDPFKGQTDIKKQTIRAVRNPEKRFQEDGLRLMRAVRLAVCLGLDKIWNIEPKTAKAIEKNANLLAKIGKERIRDELVKIIQSPNGARGIEIMRRLGLLKYVLPELELGFDIPQNKHHVFQIYQHNLLTLHYGCQNNFDFETRMACLLHDIGKPQTKKGTGENATFYHHELVGAKIAKQALYRLRFPAKQIEKITKLVKYHLFYYNVGEVGDSSVRRLLRKVGGNDIEKLLQVRYADRIGSGVAKAVPYKLRHLKYTLEKVSKDPISVKMLKINGDDIMDILKIKPGIKVGQILTYLLSEVLSDPTKNDRPYLTKETKRLSGLPENDLSALAKQAQKEIDEIKTKQDKMTKTKYWVT